MPDSTDRITEHFGWDEFACHNGTAVPEALRGNVRDLCAQLEVIRAEVGKPLRVISGYRTEAYNASRGGAKASQHVQGKAADLQVTGIAPEVLHALISRLIHEGKIKQGGLGLYPLFVHYDVRGTLARWDETRASAARA